MNYDIPTVMTAEELIDKTFRRASRISKSGTNALDAKKKTSLARITAAGDIVVTALDGYIERFPRMEKTEDFLPELMDLIVGIDRYKKSLGALNWVSHRVERLKNEALRETRRTKDPRNIDFIRNGFYGRLVSHVEQIAEELLFLQEAKNRFRELPSIDPEVPTLVIAGFPNVGKSMLVTELSTAAPQIAPYPFTTRGIIVGHIEDDWRKYQVIDTPGLLDRSFEERNAIERQAVLALRYLTDIMLFIIDPSESCGYPLEKQQALLASVQAGFTEVPVLVAESKSDIMKTGSGCMCFSAQTGEGMEELRTLLTGMLRDIHRERTAAAEF